MKHLKNPKMTVLTRRTVSAALAATVMTAAAGVGSATAATDWPKEPVTIVVAYPAGGGTDISIRALTDEMIKAMRRDIGALGILAPTHEPRATDYVRQMLDLIGNMANYGLCHLTEPFVEASNARLAQPLSVAEVRSYRKEDKATWWLLRRAFAAEQVWRRLTRAPVRHLVPAYLDTVNG